MALYPYEDEVDPKEVHINRNKLDKVINYFKNQQKSGAFPGGQLILRRFGKIVVNVSCGVARGFRSNENIESVQVKPNTPFPVLSVGKPMAGIAIALLEDRGLLDIDSPIATIFPEFANNGKEEITTLDVLTHRAGILMPNLVHNYHLWEDRDYVLKTLIETKPRYRRGTFVYHPCEFGWILSEICKRVDGRTLADFFSDEIADPLHLPALKYGLAGRNINSLAFSYWLGKEKVMVSGYNIANKFEEIYNSLISFNSMNPAFNLVTDAASMAAFYEFLINKGVTRTGKQLISEEIIQKYTEQKIISWDRTNKTFLVFGKGFMLGTFFPSIYGWWNTGKCFGHAGGLSSLAFGDYDTGIAVGIVTNGNRSTKDFTSRFIKIASRLRKVCF